jgi:hypothetical protein
MRDNIFIVCIIALIGLFLTPGIYWLFNPELTQMQLFFKFWWVYAIGLVLALILYLTDKK